VQNERLDRFHVKDNMHQVVQDIQGGRILQVRALASVTTDTPSLQLCTNWRNSQSMSYGSEASV
jgi:hypothetical protein